MINAVISGLTNAQFRRAAQGASTNAIMRGGRHMESSSSPAAARTFLSTVWNSIASALTRRRSDMAVVPSVPRAADAAPMPSKLSQEASKLAAVCYTKMIGELPGMRSHIPPEVKTIYCKKFHECYVRLQEGIPKNRLPKEFAGVFAHDLALALVEEDLPDPSGGARTPDGREQWLTWEKNMNTAVRSHLRFSMEKEKTYEALIFGNALGPNALTKADKAVLRGALDEKHCQKMYLRTMDAMRQQKRNAFPVGISAKEKNRLNAAYDSLHRKIRSEVLLQCRIENPAFSVASNFWRADGIAHLRIDARTAPQLPKKYLAWMKSVSGDCKPLLADRLFMPSNLSGLFS